MLWDNLFFSKINIFLQEGGRGGGRFYKTSKISLMQKQNQNK